MNNKKTNKPGNIFYLDCPDCGGLIHEIDTQYRKDFPTSSDRWEEELIEAHECESQYSFLEIVVCKFLEKYNNFGYYVRKIWRKTFPGKFQIKKREV